MLARAAFIFAGTLLLGAAMATLLLLYHEPTYKGRTLEHWIKANSQSPADPAAREAIVFITTNAAPCLHLKHQGQRLSAPAESSAPHSWTLQSHCDSLFTKPTF